MNLRSTLCVVTAVVAGGLLGCGEQPQYYRVSIDRSALDNLPVTCYSSGSAPTDKTTNMVDVAQWIIWEGVENKKYLQVGNIDYRLGSSRVVIPGEAIVSTADDKKTTFATERTRSNPSETTRATYTFDKLDGTIEGSLALSYSCSGTGCDPNCEATLRFTGVRIDADPMLVVANSAAN